MRLIYAESHQISLYISIMKIFNTLYMQGPTPQQLQQAAR
jgi:hypothetical protein